MIGILTSGFVAENYVDHVAIISYAEVGNTDKTLLEREENFSKMVRSSSCITGKRAQSQQY